MPVSAQQHRVKIGVFTCTLISILTRKANIAANRIRVLRCPNFSGKMTLLTLLILLLIGGVELNPGPNDYDYQLGNAVFQIKQSIGDMEHRMSSRLDTIEEGQHYINENMRSLALENKKLRDDVQFLTNKCDYLENQSRRDNLVFEGLPKPYGFESWHDCENLICEVIYQGMGVSPSVIIEIERAHRVGKSSIVCKFRSFKQRSYILSAAKNLRNSHRFSRVYVHEDFSELVKQKRQELSRVQQDLRSQGLRSYLRFDKLVAGDRIYTVDNDFQIHESQRQGHYYRTSSWQNNHTNSYPSYDYGASNTQYGENYDGLRDAQVYGDGEGDCGDDTDSYHEAHDSERHDNVSRNSPRDAQQTPILQDYGLNEGNVTPPQPTEQDSYGDRAAGDFSAGSNRSTRSAGRGRGTRRVTGNTTPIRGFGRGTPTNSGQGHGDSRRVLHDQSTASGGTSL